MTKEREALKLALEALEEAWYHVGTFQPTEKAIDLYDEARAAIKEALAQPEQETPKGWKSEIWKSVKQQEQESVTWGVDWGKAGDIPCVSIIKRVPNGNIEVMAVEYAPYSYITQPQRTWVGLTDEEIDQGLLRSDYAFKTAEAWRAGVVFAMTKLKEKNT